MSLPWEHRGWRWNPYSLYGNEVWYSLSGPAGGSTYIIDGSNRLQLVADRSGNSAVSGLVVNGVSGNYASSTKYIPAGAFRVEAKMMAVDWSPAASNVILGNHSTSGDNRCWVFFVAATGLLSINLSPDGVSGAGVRVAPSTAAVNFSDLSIGYVAADINPAGGTVDYETSTDGVTWTPLGAQVPFTALTLYAGTNAALECGSSTAGTSGIFNGIIYYARIIESSVTTKNCDPSGAAKLATSFTAPVSGETWTVNTSGATGARICGARDLYQGTQANQPIFSVSGGFNIATFDGSNDYLKSAPFSFSQPESVYFVGSQVTWAGFDTFLDGNVTNSMRVFQNDASPEFTQHAGDFGGQNGDLALGTRSVISAIFSGAASTTRVNLNSAVTGAATGTTAAGGFTLGVLGNATTQWGNITWSEVLLRSAADDAATQLKIAAFEMRKWGVS